MEEIIRAPEAAGTGSRGAQPAPAEEPVKQPPAPGGWKNCAKASAGRRGPPLPFPPPYSWPSPP